MVSLQIYSMFSLHCLDISISLNIHRVLGGKCKFDEILLQLQFFFACMLNIWKQFRNQRAKPIIVDPGLYLSKKFDLFSTGERRELPTAFKLFTGKLFSFRWSYCIFVLSPASMTESAC